MLKYIKENKQVTSGDLNWNFTYLFRLINNGISRVSGGNVSMLDNYSANSTATANTLYPLNANKFYTSSVLPYGTTVVTVDPTDYKGDFKTIQGAIDSITDSASNKRYVILVQPGNYDEDISFGVKEYISIVGVNKYTCKIYSDTGKGTVALSKYGIFANMTLQTTYDGASAILSGLENYIDNIIIESSSNKASSRVLITLGNNCIINDMKATINDGYINLPGTNIRIMNSEIIHTSPTTNTPKALSQDSGTALIENCFITSYSASIATSTIFQLTQTINVMNCFLKSSANNLTGVVYFGGASTSINLFNCYLSSYTTGRAYSGTNGGTIYNTVSDGSVTLTHNGTSNIGLTNITDYANQTYVQSGLWNYDLKIYDKLKIRDSDNSHFTIFQGGNQSANVNYILPVSVTNGYTLIDTTSIVDAVTYNTLSWSSIESPLTFSTGLTRSTNTITMDLSTGISGGQTMKGGSGASETLTLSSSSTLSTKGKILFGTSGYSEADNYLGIGTNAPSVQLDITTSDTTPISIYRTTNGVGSGIVLDFSIQNATPARATYGDIRAETVTVTHGSEAGNFVIFAKKAGTNTRNSTFTNTGKWGIGTSAPASRLELAESVTLTNNTNDAYSACLTLDPEYTGAYTLDRHNFIDLNNVASADSTITNSFVFRFDANPGTHYAISGSSTKTTPGTVDAWFKVNIADTIHYVPLYTSTLT